MGDPFLAQNLITMSHDMRYHVAIERVIDKRPVEPAQPLPENPQPPFPVWLSSFLLQDGVTTQLRSLRDNYGPTGECQLSHRGRGLRNRKRV
jgi:hypothetical protein